MLLLFLCLKLHSFTAFEVTSHRSWGHRHRRSSRISSNKNLPEPPLDDSCTFGRKDYWNAFYNSNPSFSWYSGWQDLGPFVQELVPPQGEPHVLIPGVGNDPLLVDMHKDGYHHLSAFDYSPEGVACARELLENAGLDQLPGVCVFLADARDLSSWDGGEDAVDAVLEKGALDAICLSGGTADKDRGDRHLRMAVRELARVTKPGGVIISITAACVAAVQTALREELSTCWTEIRDGSFFMTHDGYTSNNIDGTLLAWKRNEH